MNIVLSDEAKEKFLNTVVCPGCGWTTDKEHTVYTCPTCGYETGTNNPLFTVDQLMMSKTPLCNDVAMHLFIPALLSTIGIEIYHNNLNEPQPIY